ncbi:uncharacterized protein LOC141948189 isoform X2 [Strix uralensis]|uniref:uncharacterized protein LOC141948189 isoform X2 n=1 Tax=Strix uralensis TaxID=36305 RepID=UPI003DA20E6F
MSCSSSASRAFPASPPSPPSVPKLNISGGISKFTPALRRAKTHLGISWTLCCFWFCFQPFPASQVHQEGCEVRADPGRSHPSCISHSPWWRCRQPSSVPGTSLLMGQTSSSFERLKETIEFLLFKSVDWYGEVFREVQESELQPGDIVLFPMDTSSGASRSFKHAAVYCGKGEVIHFQNTESKKSDGQITKEGFKAMKKKRGKCWIYRKNGRINLNYFYSKVREAMNSEAKYDFCKNNCIHFALHLLDLVPFYKELLSFAGPN